MIAHVLTDWRTLRGTSATSVVLQSESEWLRLEGFRDLTAWIQIAQAPLDMELRVDLETSPSTDEALFKAVTSTTIETPGIAVAMSRAKLVADPRVPLATYLRWAVYLDNPYASWGVTFRVIVCANPTVPDFRMVCGDKVFESPALGGE